MTRAYEIYTRNVQ